MKVVLNVMFVYSFYRIFNTNYYTFSTLESLCSVHPISASCFFIILFDRLGIISLLIWFELCYLPSVLNIPLKKLMSRSITILLTVVFVFSRLCFSRKHWILSLFFFFYLEKKIFFFLFFLGKQLFYMLAGTLKVFVKSMSQWVE